MAIMKASLETGVVPDDWKAANVTPIFKKGSKNEIGNYRPVTLTSQICKLLEMIIRDSLVEHRCGVALSATRQAEGSFV